MDNILTVQKYVKTVPMVALLVVLILIAYTAKKCIRKKGQVLCVKNAQLVHILC